MSEFLTRERMLDALRRLGAVLQGRGIQGNIYVVGGAAVAFAYLSDRVTRDIDAIVAPEEEVFTAARELMTQLDLPEEWLNDTAKAFLPDVNVGEGQVVLEAPGIVVRTAPAEVVLAMKLLSARAKDVTDIRLLAALLGLSDRDQVWSVFLRYYPKGDLLDRSRLLVDELFTDQ